MSANNRHKVIVIGGGFAGLEVARGLAGATDRVETILIDPRQGQNFLPLLPDMVGRGLAPENLTYPFADAAARWRFSFINEAVTEIDLASRSVNTLSQSLCYDYLVISSGCCTNFFGNDALRESAFELHSVNDADAITQAVRQNDYSHFVICGGGYTGVEIATHLWKLQKKTGKSKPIYIVDRAPEICFALPEPFRKFIADNLKKMGILSSTSNGVERFENGAVHLADGQCLPESMLIWAAGVRGQDFVLNLGFDADRSSRLIVDETLMLNDHVFAAGDAASFEWEGVPLRPGIQFSLKEGQSVASNILRLVNQKKPKKFVPHDLGYVVPLANGKSCGNVMGVNFYGRFPFFLHYMMSLFRSYGLNNRIGLFRQIMGL